MPRPPLPIGTAGRIHLMQMRNGQWRARANYRDADGVTRRVARFAPTKAAAERRLKEALRDRVVVGGAEIGPESRVREVAALWLDELEHADVSDQTRDAYRRTLERRGAARAGRAAAA